MKILLVEDDNDLRDYYTIMLEYAGYTVETAPDGMTALARLHDDASLIMLVDWYLPDMTGGQLVSAIRTLNQETAIIMMSYWDVDVAVVKGCEANAWYQKQEDIQILMGLVASMSAYYGKTSHTPALQ